MKFAVENTPAAKTIVAGLTHTNLNEMIRLAEKASELGIHAGLVPCPYYFPNSFPMVLEFFKALDRATQLPLVFYDNPLYTKTFLTSAQLSTMLDACENLRAVKMTDHNLTKISDLKKRAGVAVFSGDDIVAFRSLLLNVDGSMIIAPSIFPAEYQQTVRLIAAGHTAEAMALFSTCILPFIHQFGPGDEVTVTKAVFHKLGLFRSPEVRLPLMPCPEERLAETMLAYNFCREARGFPTSPPSPRESEPVSR